MNKGLRDTAEILGIEDDEAKRQAIAKLIVRLARDGDSLDAVELRDKAVAALAIAYFAITRAPQPSNTRPSAE